MLDNLRSYIALLEENSYYNLSYSQKIMDNDLAGKLGSMRVSQNFKEESQASSDDDCVTKKKFRDEHRFDEDLFQDYKNKYSLDEKGIKSISSKKKFSSQLQSLDVSQEDIRFQNKKTPDNKLKTHSLQNLEQDQKRIPRGAPDTLSQRKDDLDDYDEAESEIFSQYSQKSSSQKLEIR